MPSDETTARGRAVQWEEYSQVGPIAMQTTKFEPVYSFMVVEDSKGGRPPANPSGEPLMWTDSCILVGCLATGSGETTFTLGSSASVDPGTKPVFAGRLKTPSLCINLATAEREVVLEAPVNGAETSVRVWTNDPVEPDNVIVGYD